MPRSSVRDVQHAAYTDHTIPKRLTRQPEGIPELKAFGGDAAPRELAIARSLIALRENNRLLAAKAAPGLLVSWNKDNKDTASGSQLAQFYDRLGREEMACEIYGKIAKTSFPPPAAENNWGACLAKAGRLVEAISFWDDVTKRAPGEESAWTNLAIAEMQVGETARAAATKERGLHFHPASKKLLEINTQR